MKKNTIHFPVFTSRQTSHNKQNSTNKPVKQKGKQSLSLLKIINEDIKRIKISDPKKGQKLENLLRNKQNIGKRGISDRLKQLSAPKKLQIMPTLQINKISKNLTNKTIIPQVTFGGVTSRKMTEKSIQNNKRSLNLKLSGQRVIVAKNRKEFSKINQQLIYERRQNYLNSKFNIRVNRLNDITKQNKKIYNRINSQRSHYSNDDLNKSYQSNASISKRLSNSKISRRSRLSMSSQRSICNSRCSIQSKRSVKYIKNKQGFHSKQVLKNKISQPKRLMKIQSKNINDLKLQQLQNFATLFSNQPLQKLKQPIQKIKIKQQKVKQKNKYQYDDLIQCKQNNQPQIKQQLSIKFKFNKNILPSLNKSRKIQSTNENKISSERSSINRQRILTTIDQNLSNYHVNQIPTLHKIIQENSNQSKRVLNSLTRR